MQYVTEMKSAEEDIIDICSVDWHNDGKIVVINDCCSKCCLKSWVNNAFDMQ